MATALQETEACFKQMMQINNNSVKVLRAYGKFLVRIRRSEPEGLALIARAERLQAVAVERAEKEISHFKMFDYVSGCLVVLCCGRAAGSRPCLPEDTNDAAQMQVKNHLALDDSVAVVVVNGKEMLMLSQVRILGACL